MISLGVPSYIVRFVDNYLDKRTFQVCLGQDLSSERKLIASVSQGSILGPTLFLIYINDVPKHPQTSLTLFADDTAVFSSFWNEDYIIKNIQSHIHELETFFQKWKIKINTNKTTAMMFTHKKSIQSTSLTILGEKIKFTENAKYLGLNLDMKLNFSNHITQVSSKAHAAISILYPLVCQKSTVSEKNKLIIYVTSK